MFVKPNMKENWDGTIKLILEISKRFILKTTFSSTIVICQSNFLSSLPIVKMKEFVVKTGPLFLNQYSILPHFLF